MKWLTQSALSLKIKLPLCIMVIIIITMSISTLFTFQNFTTVVDSVKASQLAITAENIGEHISSSITQAGRDMVMVASMPQVLQSVELPPRKFNSAESDTKRISLTLLFKRILQAYGYYNALYIVNEQGQYILGTEPTTASLDTGIGNTFLKNSQKAGGFYVENTYFSTTLNKPILPLFLEVVYNGYGGALVSSLNLEKIVHTAVQGVEHDAINTHVFAIKDQKIIDILHEGNMDLKAGPWIDALKEKNSGVCTISLHGQEYTLGFYHVPQTDLYAVTIAQPSLMTEPGDILRNTALIINTVAVAVIMLFLFYLIMPVMQEIAQLSFFAKRVTEGCHDATLHSKRHDELGHLAHSLEKMVQTLREMVQRSEAATKAKSDFLACMSHEIRTPMNGILGMTHLALQANPSPTQKDFLLRIDTAAKTLLGVINDILDFSKIEAKMLEINPVTFRISGILASIRDMLEERCHSKGLDLIFTVNDNVPDIIHSDPLRFAQICINLCSNAIKFTSKGEVKLHISVVEHSGKDLILRVDVIDTGIGIAPENQAKIFDSFSQADGTTTRKYGGTGLGLTISKSLTHLLGGTITVTSELGKGSTFSFTMHATQGHETELQEKDQAHTHKIPLPHLHILLVEDNEINQEIALAVLENMGATVTLATHGAEGVAHFEKGNFDLILMDIQMPIMDGITAAQTIRQSSHSAAKTIPIIAMTAHAMSGDREKSLAAGMNDHITKPIDMDELYTALATWGQKKTLPQTSA